MAEAVDSRDSDNNWVIANNEGFPVETLGAAQTETPSVHPEPPPPCSDSGHKDEEIHDFPGPEGSKESPLLSTPSSFSTLKPHVDIPPEEPASTPEDSEQHLPKLSSGFTSRVDEELEEVSCSSSDDDADGLRKRKVKGSPPVNVGASPKEAAKEEDDGGFGLTLNKCIIAALALIGIGFLAFSGGFSAEEDTPEVINTRSVIGEDGQPQAIVDIQEWMNKHAAQFSGDPGSFKVMSDLLDKVAKENQDIRHMQATLQTQKEELESILKISEGERVSSEPEHEGLSEENLRLKEALLREETAHLSAKEELQNLREKMETMEGSSLEGQQLISENAKLKDELDASRKQIESFLMQKETLVAEAQMLRQELDQQRSLVGTLRQDLESLIAQKSSPETAVDKQQLQGKISDISNRLALEVQRSETWEKTYVEHAEKRKSQVGDYSPKEWKKGEKHGRVPNVSASAGEFRKHGKDYSKRLKEGEVKESEHDEWKNRKHEHREEQRDRPWHKKKHRHWEGEQRGGDNHPSGNVTVKEHEKNREHHHSDSTRLHPEDQERGWKEKHSKHHGEAEGGFHPRKGQKDFVHTMKEEEEEYNHKHKVTGGKPHPKESPHKHHDHNKFWKKLSDHQYRVPEGCSGVEDCARKDGIDLFNVELKPVQRKQFEDLLHSYLAKANFSKHLQGLVPLLDGFFEGHVFAHDKVRFRDFVDDVEDFLEDLAKEETGSDDAVDDFEKYVYTHFFGEAANKKKKKRFAKKEVHKINGTNEDHRTEPSSHEPHRYHKKGKRKEEDFQAERSQTEDPRSPDHKPPKKEYHKSDVRYHQDERRPPVQYSHYKDPKHEHEGTQNDKDTNKNRDQHKHGKFHPEHEDGRSPNRHQGDRMSNLKEERHHHNPKPSKSEHKKKEGYVHKKHDQKDWSHSHHNREEKGHDTSGKHDEWKAKTKNYGKVDTPKQMYKSQYPQDEMDGKPHHKHEHKPYKQKYEKETTNQHRKLAHDQHKSHVHHHPHDKNEGKKPWKDESHDRMQDEFSYKARRPEEHYHSSAKYARDRDQSRHDTPKQKWPKENPHGHKQNRNDGDKHRRAGRDPKDRQHS